jgi:hypothetical protein
MVETEHAGAVRGAEVDVLMSVHIPKTAAITVIEVIGPTQDRIEAARSGDATDSDLLRTLE